MLIQSLNSFLPALYRDWTRAEEAISRYLAEACSECSPYQKKSTYTYGITWLPLSWIRHLELKRTVKQRRRRRRGRCVQFQMEIRKISRRRPSSVNGAEIGHFTLLFAEDGKEMYKDLERTCTATVSLIKPFVWRRSRCRHHRGLLKLPKVQGQLRKLIIHISSLRATPLFAFGLFQIPCG